MQRPRRRPGSGPRARSDRPRQAPRLRGSRRLDPRESRRPGGSGFLPVSAIARACRGSRAASATSCPRSARTRANAVPTPRHRRRRRSRRLHEVDRHGHPLEVEAVAQLVLDPVAVVPGDQARVVDRRESAAGARWSGCRRAGSAASRFGMGPGEPRSARRGIGSARRSGPVPCTCRRAPRRVETAPDAALGHRRGGDDRRTLAQPQLEPVTDLLDPDLVDVPLREDDERRGHRFAGDVGNAEVVLDDALGASMRTSTTSARSAACRARSSE